VCILSLAATTASDECPLVHAALEGEQPLRREQHQHADDGGECAARDQHPLQGLEGDAREEPALHVDAGRVGAGLEVEPREQDVDPYRSGDHQEGAQYGPPTARAGRRVDVDPRVERGEHLACRDPPVHPHHEAQRGRVVHDERAAEREAGDAPRQQDGDHGGNQDSIDELQHAVLPSFTAC
jgi:hypothetical protein